MKTWPALLLAASISFATQALADDSVVARVNGVEVKQSQLDFAESELGPRLANFPPEDRRRVLLQYVLEAELMAEAAEKEKLNEAPTFADRVKYHERRALRDAFYDSSIRAAVPEADAKKIFDEKIATVKPDQQVHARHILVETEAEAKDVIARLKKGEDFAKVAKEKSKDSNAEGGDLGFFSRGQMLKPFEDAAFALEPGQISEPVHTQFGWHVIKVEEKRDAPLPTFDQVKEAIMAQLVQEKAQQIVTGLKDSAKIEIVDPTIKKQMDDAAKGADPSSLPAEQPEEANPSDQGGDGQ